jgi:hypothetical protein
MLGGGGVGTDDLCGGLVERVGPPLAFVGDGMMLSRVDLRERQKNEWTGEANEGIRRKG